MSDGNDFERRVVEQLLALGADLERSDYLNHVLKVDFSIRGFKGHQPHPKAVDVQMTFQGGNIEKMVVFLKKQPVGRDTVRLYVVVNTDARTLKTALLIRAIYKMKRIIERPIHGVFVGNQGFKFFDIERRIAYLMARADPEKSDHRRAQGRITRVGHPGVAAVESLDGGEYIIRMGDIPDRKLRAMIGEPEIFHDQLIGRLVSFIPHERNALSVLLVIPTT